MGNYGGVQVPRIQVVLGDVMDLPVDLVVVARGHAASDQPGVAVVDAPRWRRDVKEHELAAVYRRALALASERGARSLGLPTSLSTGPWPIDDLTRIALNVISSTPSSVRRVMIAVPTPAALERWAEAIVRES